VVIGKGAILQAKSGVIASLEGGKTYFGAPAKEFKTKWREYAALAQLPAILHKLHAEEKAKSEEQ
jgi:UDP-3-O-[3-hydroxymyristoyl] glucosamine N-acyltransferase